MSPCLDVTHIPFGYPNHFGVTSQFLSHTNLFSEVEETSTPNIMA